MRECPGRIGPGAQGPIGPSQPIQGGTLIGASRRGESPCPPLLPPLAAGPRLGGGARADRPPLYIKRAGAPPPTPLLLNPSRPAALLSLSLPTACRRSPAAETLHHLHRAVALLIQSISPPHLLDRGRRRLRGSARVHLSEASPLVVLDRIGSRGGEASTTTSPTFRRTFRCANLQGYEDLI